MRRSKQMLACLLAVVLVLACAGCGGKKAAEGEETEQTLTGTLDEVKDFMFVVTDDTGDSYALTFDGDAPEGLKDQTVGSRVTVTYTGELSVVDSFTGKVLSVEAAEKANRESPGGDPGAVVILSKCRGSGIEWPRPNAGGRWPRPRPGPQWYGPPAICGHGTGP